MKVTKVFYKKQFSIGREEEEIGIEVEVEFEKGEKVEEVLQKVKRFVELKMQYEKSRYVLDHPQEFMHDEIESARKFLENYKSDIGL